MGSIQKPEKVKLVSAITFKNRDEYQETKNILKNHFGKIDSESEIFDFNHTDYYEKEMGKNLKKVFISFENLINPDELPAIKNRTNAIENSFLREEKRKINIDPGYISRTKLILATTKNYAHRIYLKDGIFGDLHLFYKDGSFHPQPWTYPDYKEKFSIEFFKKVRSDYLDSLKNSSSLPEKLTYKSAGVDIDEQDKGLDMSKTVIKGTFNGNVLADFGKFGGFYRLPIEDYKNPVLVSSVDGVGTKLKIAAMMNKHDTVGMDLVNHCVNDILCCGAKPLFFLDYVGSGKLKAGVLLEVIKGLAAACKENRCVLIGGETAEMPGFYSENEYDLVGTIVGVIEKEKIIDGTAINEGDVLIGLPSTGLHTNGYSLARKVFFEVGGYTVDSYIDELGETVGEALLKTHISYLNQVYPLIEENLLSGIAHITGSGIHGNVSRLLNPGLREEIFWDRWAWLPVFNMILKIGNVDENEMKRTFNLGIGMILISRQEKADEIIKRLDNAQIIGIIRKDK